MKFHHNIIASAFIGIAGVLWMQSASAVPAFAAKHDKKCSSCHTAWPQLNAKGRAFKERGYRVEAEIKEGTESAMEAESLRSLVSAFLIARPYDKKDSGDVKLRAIQEVELFVTGAIDDNFSGFFAIEAEDENDFNAEVSTAKLAYRYSDAINVQMSWAQVFESDPYSFLRNSMRLTRGRPSIIDQRFNSQDRLRDTRQNFTLTGRVIERLFYSVSYTGAPKNAEGEDASGIALRAAFDITPDIMIGAFHWSGEDNGVTGTANDRLPIDYSRTGFDFQVDLASTRISGGYVQATDDNYQAGSVVGENDNVAMSVQAYHTFRTKSGKPGWVPLIRYDSYEKNDGQDQYDELTLNLGYYIQENAKGFIEYWDQIDTPDGIKGDSRLTLQLQVGF
ncbi:MAG TPA: hypothetical protein ENJ08_00445 [Gammaproteobacteria bacterium]|nr:hypothetical protein [Gammaproteobacteria bacterium]